MLTCHLYTLFTEESKSFAFFFLSAPCTTCRILIPSPGIELRPLEVKVQSTVHWTAKEFPCYFLIRLFSNCWVQKVFKNSLDRSTLLEFLGLGFFRLVLGSQQNWAEGTEISRILLAPPHAQPLLLSTSFTRVEHLLQLMNLLWHIIITQSP